MTAPHLTPEERAGIIVETVKRFTSGILPHMAEAELLMTIRDEIMADREAVLKRAREVANKGATP